jgi:pimeloyl-ACP methyl ester carboxylesterase
MSHSTPPELRRWGADNPSQVLVGVHGFAGGAHDYERLAQDLTETDSGLQVVSYYRGRDWSLVPPAITGTGAIQTNAVELLSLVGKLSQDDRINSLNLVGHSLGGPIIAAAYDMVCADNLPPLLSKELDRLTQILDRASITLIAPAGLTNAYALMPTSGFAAHSLVKAIFNGTRIIVSDTEDLAELWTQRQRAISATRYLAKIKFSLEECIDACGPQTMQALAGPDLAKVTLIAYEKDEIFPAEKVKASLKDPNIRNHDFALYKALLQLKPKELARLVLSVYSLEDIMTITGLKTVVAYISTEIEPWDPSTKERKALSELADRTVVLPGNHATPLTCKGAAELAEHLNLAT